MIMWSLKWICTEVLGDINGFIKASVYLLRNPLGRSKKALTLGHSDWSRLQEERPRGASCHQDHRGTCKPRAEVRVHDPFVPSLATEAGVFASVGNVEEALSGAERAIFLVDHGVFRGISVERVKGPMASPVVVDGKNLFAGGEGIVYLGIGKGLI